MSSGEEEAQGWEEEGRVEAYEKAVRDLAESAKQAEEASKEGQRAAHAARLARGHKRRLIWTNMD